MQIVALFNKYGELAARAGSNFANMQTVGTMDKESRKELMKKHGLNNWHRLALPFAPAYALGTEFFDKNRTSKLEAMVEDYHVNYQGLGNANYASPSLKNDISLIVQIPESGPVVVQSSDLNTKVNVKRGAL